MTQAVKKRAKKRNNLPEKIEAKEPCESVILLTVCYCYRDEKLTLVIARANEIARILNISPLELECFVIQAMFSGVPLIVARFKQADLAEQKFKQISDLRPFIARACHSFNLVSG
jgi:hypothetical protein